MSTGTIKKADGRLTHGNGTSDFPGDVAANADYLSAPARQFLTDTFKLSEASLAVLNQAIGKFSQALLDASLVDGEWASNIAEQEVRRPGLNRASTLSMGDVVRTAYNEFPEAVGAMIDSLDPEDRERFGDYEQTLRGVRTVANEPRNGVAVSPRAIDENAFMLTRLIAPEVATMIDRAFESGVAAAIEKSLATLGTIILSRALLSQSSFSSEVRASEHLAAPVAEGVRYSTLDVEHLIEWTRRFFSEPRRFTFSLPMDSRVLAVGNLHQASEARGEALA